MQKVILLLVIIGLASALKAESYNNLWSTFKTRHSKYYTAAEEVTRLGIFIENLEKIQRLNAQNDGVKYGINQFSDLTNAEFGARFATGAFYDEEDDMDMETVTFPEGDLPDNVDWRNKGAVTPVKNQGNCGSCWAFSTTGLLESFYFINNGKLLSFSEQQIVDCAYQAGYGCQGGWPYLAVDYAAKNGLEVEDDYPYTAKDGNCQYEKEKAVAVAKGYKTVAKTAKQLKTALVSSPVSVCVQADEDVFQFYKSGVVRRNCGARINHAVLAVGYQKVGIDEAYIVKNSWGTSWGADGYIYLGTEGLANLGKGVCGILTNAVIAK